MALLYDPRNTGASGGHPRNDIDPSQSVGDISDALSHLLTLPSVIPMQVGLTLDQDRREIAPWHVNSVTLMTYYEIALWTP
ncbi:hypothetical protein DL765_008263 [Monosporascus sp. GIB2]|nr:hypothetical protein DL765_008263 [Monosporascus sp. GIB2]